MPRANVAETAKIQPNPEYSLILNYPLIKTNKKTFQWQNMTPICKSDYLSSSRRELTLTKEDVQENAPYRSKKRFKSSAFSNQVKAGYILVSFFTLRSIKMDPTNKQNDVEIDVKPIHWCEYINT